MYVTCSQRTSFSSLQFFISIGAKRLVRYINRCSPNLFRTKSAKQGMLGMGFTNYTAYQRGEQFVTTYYTPAQPFYVIYLE